MGHQGEALDTIFRRAGVNISSLAQKIGVSRSAVYNWTHMAVIPYENLEKISKALDMDIFSEIQKVLKIPAPIKKYEPIAKVEEPSEQYGEKTFLQVALDGNEENLERLIQKLKALNEALKSYREAIS